MTLAETTEAENIARAFREFSYVVSHDLGAPLRAMVQFSKLLKSENAQALSGESELYLSMIIENGEKAQGMLGALLQYSRVNTATMLPELTDLNQLIQQCREEMADKILSSNAKINVEELPTLHTDAAQFKLLLQSMLANAITFLPEGRRPEITLSASKRDDCWLFALRDNGIGIESRFHEKIFLPFKRLHPEGKYPGVGMGLTLAKKVVEHQGGHIWLESEPDKGTTFLFSVPERRVV